MPPWEKPSVAAARIAASCFTVYNLRMGNSAPAIRVKVLFFGRLKEIAGHSDDVLDLAEGAPIEALFARCVAQLPELARYRPSLVASRNHEFPAWSPPLPSGATL